MKPKTKTNDMLVKTITALFKAYKNRGSRYLHAKGCTISVAEHVNYLSAWPGLKILILIRGYPSA